MRVIKKFQKERFLLNSFMLFHLIDVEEQNQSLEAVNRAPNRITTQGPVTNC